MGKCEVEYEILTEENTIKEFPVKAKVACQGVEGAYSQIACDKMFENADKKYYKTFEQVFEAIENEECEYGVLPIENSTAGSVYAVYDLIMRYHCYIVRSYRLKVQHNLLAKKGVKKEDIREVMSHEQALGQCEDYIKNLNDGNVEAVQCRNTAYASKKVAELDRNDVAAISSKYCAKLYGLDILDEEIQDKDTNYTRFICISKKRELYYGADQTSLMLILSHIPGSLYRVLRCFYKYNINLVKLESRPAKDYDNEYMFYFDIESGMDRDYCTMMLNEICDLSIELRYLGTYKAL